MKSKKMIGMLMAMTIIGSIVSGCSKDSTDEKNATEQGVLEYKEKSSYSKDIQALATIKTAVATYLVGSDAVYEDSKEYTLKELINIDSQNVIASLVEQIFISQGNGGALVFDASSKVFEGITTDDVRVVINKGLISILVPVNAGWEDEYDPYVAGTYEWSEKMMVK